MKIVIDIPESIYETIEKDQFITRFQLAVLQSNIRKGVPLPKSHGRLIDEDTIRKIFFRENEESRIIIDNGEKQYKTKSLIFDRTDAPTIIEADKESEEV